MPELPNRDVFEAAIEEALAKVSAPARRIVLQALGNPPRLENMTDEVWADLAGRYNGALLPQLERVFLAGAQALSEVTAGVSWELVNEAAAQWASRYTYDLVRGINDTSRGLLQRYVEDFYRTNEDLPTLRERIAQVFGQQRAHNIAITETTRASVEGERVVARELEGQGLNVHLEPVWNTVAQFGSGPGAVCPICEPYHLQPVNGPIVRGHYPPEHVGCRCFITYEVVT